MMCGAALRAETPPVPPSAPTAPPAPPTQRPWWEWSGPPWHVPPQPPHVPDIAGLFSFAMFLMIVAVVFALNPLVFQQFFEWVGQFGRTAGVPRPPEALIGSAALLFAVGGVSGFVAAGLRFFVVNQRWRALGDVLSGTASLALGFLLSAYGNRALSGWAVIALEVAVVALLIFLYVLLSFLRWRTWWMGVPRWPPPESGARPDDGARKP